MIGKMQTERYERLRKAGRSQKTMEVKRSLKEITENFARPLNSMTYFYEALERYMSGDNDLLNGQKVIASTCIHVPVELIYALGAFPVRICSGAFTSEQHGAEFLPAKACPLVKSTFGDIYLDLLPGAAKPDLIINPTTCDQKRKMGEFSDDFEKEFYLLELPPTKDTEEAREYWYRTVKKLVRKLETVTGKRLTRNRLKKAIGMVAKAQSAYRKFIALRKKAPVIFGKDAMLIANTYFFDDIVSWTKHVVLLNEEMEERISTEMVVIGPDTPRIMMTGSPSIFPNMKLPMLIEKLGGFMASEEFCSGSRMLHDTVAVDEWWLYDMVPAVADRYLKPSTCPNFTPNDDRIRKILNNIKEFKIEGVVYQIFTGCQLYDMEARSVGKALEKEGIPVLFVETDYNPDDFGQLTTRIEAFLESLKRKK